MLGQGSEDATRCLKFINNLTTTAYISTDDPSETEDSAVEEAVLKALLTPGAMPQRSGVRLGQTFIDISDIVDVPARDDRAEMLLVPDENYSLHQESIEVISDWRLSQRRLERVQNENLSEISDLFVKTFLQREWFSRMWVV